MNESFWPGVKITGISPLSCPPKHAKGSGKDHSYAMARAELLTSTNSLSEQDIRNLSFQSYFVPEKTPQLFTVMDNHIQVLKMVFTDTSFIYVTVKDFYSEIKRMSIQLDNYEEKDGMCFFLAIQAATHTAIAIFVNKTLRNPSSASKSLQISLDGIINSLMNSTFMNMYALPFTKKNGDDDNSGNATNANSGSSPPQNESTNQSDPSSKTGGGGNGQPGRGKRRKVHNPFLSETCSTIFNMSAMSKAIKDISADNVPKPKINRCEMCHKWFLKGVCDSSCPRKETHIKLSAAQRKEWTKFKEKAEERARDNSVRGQ